MREKLYSSLVIVQLYTLIIWVTNLYSTLDVKHNDCSFNELKFKWWNKKFWYEFPRVYMISLETTILTNYRYSNLSFGKRFSLKLWLYLFFKGCFFFLHCFDIAFLYFWSSSYSHTMNGTNFTASVNLKLNK